MRAKTFFDNSLLSSFFAFTLFFLSMGGGALHDIQSTTFRSQSSSPAAWVKRPELRSLAWQEGSSPIATTVKELKPSLRCDRPRDPRLCCTRVSLLAFCTVFVLDSSELKAGPGKEWRGYRVFLTSTTRRAPDSEGLPSEHELFVKRPWKLSLVVAGYKTHWAFLILTPESGWGVHRRTQQQVTYNHGHAPHPILVLPCLRYELSHTKRAEEEAGWRRSWLICLFGERELPLQFGNPPLVLSFYNRAGISPREAISAFYLSLSSLGHTSGHLPSEVCVWTGHSQPSMPFPRSEHLSRWDADHITYRLCYTG